MIDLLKLYPFDPNGEIEINYIRGELHKLNSSRGKDAAFLRLRKGPFHKKDLIIIDKATKYELKLGDDYTLNVPFINEGNIKDCFCVVEILDKRFFDSALLVDYRTLGTEMVFDEVEIVEYLANREINPRQIQWSSVLNNPGRFNPEGHLHHIKDFFEFNTLVEQLKEKYSAVKALFEQYEQGLQEHIATTNAHNIELVDLNLYHLRFLSKAWAELWDKVVLTNEERAKYITAAQLITYLEENFAGKGEAVAISVDGPLRVRQGSIAQWTISNYDSFSDYTINCPIGTFVLDGEYIFGEFYVTDPLGKTAFTVTRNGVAQQCEIMVDEAGIAKPSITGIVNGEDNIPLSAGFASTSFQTVPAGRDTLTEVIYQVSFDRSFNDLLITVRAGSPIDPVYIALDKFSTYFLRVKHIGTIYESEWSEPVQFTTADIELPNLYITSDSDLYSGNRYAHDLVLGMNIADNYLASGSFTAVEYKLRKVIAGSEERPIVAFSGTKTVNYQSNTQATINWCPLQNSDNADKGLYGVGGYTDRPDTLEDNTIYDVIARICLNEDDWSDWSAPMQFTSATARYETVTESEVVGTGASAYTRYYEKRKIIYS